MRLRKIWLLCNLVCIIPGAFAQQFIHPGVLHSEKSLERIKRLVDQKAQPADGSYEILAKLPEARADYQMKGPFEIISRDGKRTDDRNLADANATNEKTSDMKNRVAKMDSEQPDAVISIHQNSYTDSSAKGAQVFYYSESKEGKVLAEILQKSLIEHADPENHRMAKANTSYYILKNTAAPTVIVECGFLSNPEEETLLNTAQYQDKLVDALQKGICEYLEN